MAALVLGQVGDPRRFPTRDRFAYYNGTAPIEASSGPRVRQPTTHGLSDAARSDVNPELERAPGPPGASGSAAHREMTAST